MTERRDFHLGGRAGNKQEANKTTIAKLDSQAFSIDEAGKSRLSEIAFSNNSSVTSLSVTFHSESSGPSAPAFPLPARATLPFRPTGPKRKHLAVFLIDRDYLALPALAPLPFNN